MTHNPLCCIWNRWVVPLFMGKSYSQGNQPTFEELHNDEKQALLNYIYDGHNLDDFHDWIRANRRSHNATNLHGANLWSHRFSNGKHELVLVPDIGPAFYVAAVAFYGGILCGGVFLLYALWIGTRQIFLFNQMKD